MFCCAVIPQDRVGIIERFGQFKREATAGLHFLCCCLGESLRGTVSLRVNQLNIRCDTKTKDNVFVEVAISVQYRALTERIYDAYYRLSDPEGQIKSYIYNVVRGTVPQMRLDKVFESQSDISEAVSQQLEKVLGEYGYQLLEVLVTDITPDREVARAMNEINAAERLRMAAADKAEAAKIQMVKQAEAEAESKYLAGTGVARQRKAIIDGLRDSVMGFSEGVEGATTKDVMDLVIITQYFDTLKEMANGTATTVFTPYQPGALSELTHQIAMGVMEGNSKGKERG